MNCQGKFKFKSIVKRDAGEFTNNEGVKIPYKASYSLKVDEVTNSGIYERNFKIPVDSKLPEILSNVKPYDDIVLDFEISFYSSGIRLTPVALIK